MFEIKESPIHGRGLFASAFIPANTIIGPIEGQPATEDGIYVLWIDETRGIEVTNAMKFINHASGDAANAAYYDDLTVVALCDIFPGQEILHDYFGDGQLGETEAVQFEVV